MRHVGREGNEQGQPGNNLTLWEFLIFLLLKSCINKILFLKTIADTDNNKYKGSIYMVFEYMDHDLTGLADRPGLRFTVPQIKVLKALLRFVLFAIL